MILFLILIFLFTILKASGVHVENFVEKRAYDYDLYESVLDPESCQRHLQEMRAFEFYDASFRIPQNILKGNMFGLGNYHQCLAINQPSEEGSIRGKYCLIQTQSLNIPVLTGRSWPANVTWTELTNIWLDHNLDMYRREQKELSILNGDDSQSRISVIMLPFTLALCIPRSCGVDDVLRPLLQEQMIEFNYTEEFCRLPDDKPYSGADVTAVVLFSIIGCFTLLSTAYELHHIFIKNDGTKPEDLKSCFSVYGNTDRLMTVASKPGALDCLDGIRVLSILWVLLGHSFLSYYNVYASNMLDILQWTGQVRSLIITAADISVDSFFVLSGLLLVYVSAKKMKQMELLKNLHLFYLNRLLRMFPLLAAAVLLQASVFHQVADGVRWNRVAFETQKCRNYWWSALLHVQNIVNPREICLGHSWYLSVDVQLHILSPLLLYWVLGNRRSAWAGLLLGLFCSLSFTTIYCFIRDFSDWRYLVYYYRNTLVRSPAFIIGMLCGYILHLYRDKKLKLSPVVLCAGYGLAMVMAAYSMYHVHPDWESEVVVNLNNAFVRSMWAASVCWLIVACVHGYAGPINWFLSLKIWKFLARISYAMYLFHMPMMFVSAGAIITPIYYTMEGFFIYYASDVAYSVIVSIVACVLIEAPFFTLIQKMMSLIVPSPGLAKKHNKEHIEGPVNENKSTSQP